MVLRRIGFSRVEREPLGAMVGNYSVRRTGNRGINRSEKRRNALKRPCAGLTMVDWRRRRDLRQTKSEVSTPRRWMTNLAHAPESLCLCLPRGLATIITSLVLSF